MRDLILNNWLFQLCGIPSISNSIFQLSNASLGTSYPGDQYQKTDKKMQFTLVSRIIAINKTITSIYVHKVK